VVKMEQTVLKLGERLLLHQHMNQKLSVSRITNGRQWVSLKITRKAFRYSPPHGGGVSARIKDSKKLRADGVVSKDKVGPCLTTPSAPLKERD